MSEVNRKEVPRPIPIAPTEPVASPVQSAVKGQDFDLTDKEITLFQQLIRQDNGLKCQIYDVNRELEALRNKNNELTSMKQKSEALLSSAVAMAAAGHGISSDQKVQLSPDGKKLVVA